MICLKQLVWIFTAVVVAGCSSSPIKEDTIVGAVTKVHDGDSIHITPAGAKRVVIRLAGIDAPEIAQAFGIASRDKLRSMILNRQARARCHKQDKYQRQVCVVTTVGADINLQMVQAGMAWHYKQYESEQSFSERRQYSAAQKNAQRNKLGLWAQDSMAPWEFRQANR
jgi:endonuclease YncB( thermonuclease family)